jgi:hypothetical protein
VKYAILIYETPDAYANISQDEMVEVMQAHTSFMETHAPVLRGGEALEGVNVATKIVKGVVTDGPFIDSKEALGGFYLVEAADLDEAIAIAKQVPAKYGGVEVRPVWDTSQG